MAMPRRQARNALVRDLLQYYKPRLKRDRLSGDILQARALSRGSSVGSGATTPQPEGPLVAYDPTLTSLAQLGCFLLDCEKSFISILDTDSQYVIAEAARAVSSDGETKTGPCGNAPTQERLLDLNWDISLQALEAFTALDDNRNVADELVTLNQHVHVMNDMSLVESLKDRPLLLGNPDMKFYAAVPIKSETGVIGIYCVVDKTARSGLDDEGLESLNELAGAIVQHLELLKNQYDLQRARGMVEGLSLFVEGNSDWSEQESKGTSELRSTTPLRSPPEAPHEESEDPISKAIDSHIRPELPEVAVPPGVASAKSMAVKRTSSNASLGPRERKLSVDETALESLAPTGTMKLFSSASSLIRQAMGLDGVIFMDGGFSSGVVNLFNPAAKQPSPEKSPPSKGKDRPRPGQNEHKIALSELLGHSVQENSGLVHARDGSRQRTLSRTTLRELLKDYWQGLIFIFDEDSKALGVCRPGENIEGGSSETFREFQDESKKDLMRQILATCPRARTVIFFPLWDPQRDRWSVGGLAWSTSPSGVLQSHDITYLTAFGRCIMSEKSRLDVTTADRAKSNFISSVSHELRSPLHGILASAEALQETATDFAQDDLIRTITICGEVLLDTTDQILDYAKTTNSNSSDSTLTRITKRSRGSAETLAGKISSMNLSNLVEAVVEGIFAGHTYRRSSLDSSGGSKRSNSDDSATIATSLADIIVIITIEWRKSWAFESHVGGWKRIVMNLFGNALKYTKSGFVHVSLRVEHIPATKPPRNIIATLEIEDSGIGMSESYQKHHLYAPFAQEDPMSAGTGLGLSIVRQLVTELGGTIGIHSEEGSGTTVRVTAPVERSVESAETLFPDGGCMLSDVRSRCQDLTMCLVGFGEDATSCEGQALSRPTPTAQTVSTLKSSLERYGSDWFGMKITQAPVLEPGKCDVFLALQSKLDIANISSDLPPLLIFEDDPLNTNFRNLQGTTLLTQPVGPQKLARVLWQCLQQRDAAKELSDLGRLTTPEIPVTEAILPRDEPDDPSKRPGREHELLATATARKVTQEAVPLPSNSPTVQLPSSSTTSIAHSIETNIPRRSRVLLVEDSVTNLTILSRFMEKGKEEYVTACDGLEAVDKYQSAPESFKVIFMDIAMPVMDGLSSTRNIRNFELEYRFPRTRIVALTCFSSAETQAEAFLSGMDMFLIKPVPMKALKPILDMDPDDFPATG